MCYVSHSKRLSLRGRLKRILVIIARKYESPLTEEVLFLFILFHEKKKIRTSQHQCFEFVRYKSKKKAFTKANKKWTDDLGKKSIENTFKKMIRYCKTIRVIAHSQVNTLFFNINCDFQDLELRSNLVF